MISPDPSGSGRPSSPTPAATAPEVQKFCAEHPALDQVLQPMNTEDLIGDARIIGHRLTDPTCGRADVSGHPVVFLSDSASLYACSPRGKLIASGTCESDGAVAWDRQATMPPL